MCAEHGAQRLRYQNLNTPAAQEDFLKSKNTDYKTAAESAQAWGIGGSNSRALNAVTIAITGALGGQTDLQVAANSLSPYAAQLTAHAILGATLAYVNGGNPAAGGSAAVAAESAADYLSQKYKDNPDYQNANGEFEANRLPEDVKAQIRDLTSAIGAVVGGTVGDSAFNAQLAGVVGQNAVENNGDSTDDYRLAPERSKRMYDDTCVALGMSGAACGAYLRKEGFEILKGAAELFVPTEPYELIPFGKGVAIAIKGTKKLKAIYNDAQAARKAVDSSAMSAAQKQKLREDLARQAGIPRNIYNNPASVWGKSVDQIKQSFEMDGAIVTKKPPRASSSGNAQVYSVENSASGIKEFQYSPSTLGNVTTKQSTHMGEYYKITYSNGSKVKVIDTNSYKLTFEGNKPIYDTNTTYMNSNGQIVKFNTSTNKWVPVK